MSLVDFALRLPLYLDRIVIVALLECLVIHEVCRLWNEDHFQRAKKPLFVLITIFGLLFALLIFKRAYQLIPF